MSGPLTIGVLALQGDFAAHAKALGRLGCRVREVRRPKETEDVDGLVLPGGETTTLLKLLRETGLWDRVRSAPRERRPVFGTCAGLILLADQVSDPVQDSMALLSVSVRRNAYGRQVDSFVVPGSVWVPPDLAASVTRPARSNAAPETPAAHLGVAHETPAVKGERGRAGDGEATSSGGVILSTEFVFIRAPKIDGVREPVEVLARHEGAPVLVRSGWILGASFHPELTDDGLVERIFLAMVAKARAQRPGGNGGR